MSPTALAWKPSVDRRAYRSDAPSVAARIYLDRVRARCGLEQVVLAEGETIVAVSSPETECVGGAMLARIGRDIVLGESSAGLEGADVFAHAVHIGRRACVLVSVGQRVDRVRTVAADLTRILA
jgi:hypothetical protein